MVAIIVGTHGKFSEEIIRSSEMIFGKQENIAAITFEPGENPEDLVQKYEDTIKNLNCDNGLLFMVDLFGGSPYNAASRVVIGKDNMDIVTGISLPMLLETFGARGFSSVEELVNIAKSAASDSVRSFKEAISQSEEEDL